MRFLGSLTLVAAAACAMPADPAPDTPFNEILKLARESKTAYRAFSILLEEGRYAKARMMLSIPSRQKLSEEEFVLAMMNFDQMRRMMTEAQVHRLDIRGNTGTARICNPEFRMSQDFAMVKEGSGPSAYWTFELTADQIRNLTDGVLEWYHELNDDGVRHVYPTGYPHPASRRKCDCGYQR